MRPMSRLELTCLSSRSSLSLSIAVAAAMILYQGAAMSQTPSGVDVKITAQPQTATVGDPIRIDWEFALPGGYQLQFPHLSPQVGDFTVLETYPGREIPPIQAGANSPSSSSPAAGTGSAGLIQYRARIVVAAYKTGELEFPSLGFVLRDVGGKEAELSSPPIRIRIESVLAGNDLKLKDLKKQAEIDEPIRWLFWSAIALCGLVLVLLGWWWIKRRRKRQLLPASAQPEIDPMELAETELRNLVGRGLLGEGLHKEFYIDLADIVKRLLEATYGIQTLEKTTAEIIDALARPPVTGARSPEASSFERIETFLLSCDVVKFARYTPLRTENEGSILKAFAILDDCRKWRQVALAGTAQAEGVA